MKPLRLYLRKTVIINFRVLYPTELLTLQMYVALFFKFLNFFINGSLLPDAAGTIVYFLPFLLNHVIFVFDGLSTEQSNLAAEE